MSGCTVPVYDIVGLLCADDAQRVDGGVGRREVGVLSRSSGETARGALTASQKLTHAGQKNVAEFRPRADGRTDRQTVERHSTNAEKSNNRSGTLDH